MKIKIADKLININEDLSPLKKTNVSVSTKTKITI
jgi:hypothetical protein